MQPVIRRYQLGLAILGIFTVVIVGLVLVKANSTREDTLTYTAANKIADKLDAYISAQQTIPSSLASAGAKDIPASITYQKLSDTSYKFCVTYKSKSSGFDAGEAVTDVATGSLSSTNNDDTGFDDSGDNSYLYLSSTHNKGQSCQTIKPYLNNDYNYDMGSSSSNSSSTSPLDVLSGTQAKARDAERQVDLHALQAQLESYYATNGYYPTLANLNDATWLATNFKALDREALRDPSGSGYAVTALPIQNSYSYDVKSASFQACDDVKTPCTQYVLTATLSDSTAYTVLSLN